MKKISAEQQWKLTLAKNEHNKIMAETLIVYIASDGPNGIYPVMLLFLFLLLVFYIFAVAALIFFKEAPNKNET